MWISSDSGSGDHQQPLPEEQVGMRSGKAERCGQGQRWVWTICWRRLLISSSAYFKGNSTPSFGSRASKRSNRWGFRSKEQEQPRRGSEAREILVVHTKSWTRQGALNTSCGKMLSTGTAIALKTQLGLAYIKMSKGNKGVWSKFVKCLSAFP